MKHLNQMILPAGIIALLVSCHPAPKPPVAKEVPVQVMIDGKTFADPYQWMENTRDSGFVQYIRHENQYCDGWFDRFDDLRRVLYTELAGRKIPETKESDSSARTLSLIEKRYFVMIERKSLVPAVRIVDIKTRSGPERENRITFPDPDGNVTYEGYDSIKGKILLRYSSILTPLTLYAYDPVSRKLMIRWQRKTAGYNKEDYAAKLLSAKSRDGRDVPVTILYKQGLDNKDGTNPLLLVAAGSDSLPDPVKFNPEYISLLDRGFYVAKAFVRGAGECGPVWRSEGSGEKKMNGTSDYLDCARFLIAQKYTSAGLITATGRSSGGIFAASAVNDQPGIFKAAILDNPGSDSLVYVPDQYIKKQEYPPMFYFAEMKGPEWSASLPARMVAGLRKMKTGEKVLLLRTSMNNETTEPGEADPRTRKSAEMWTFVLEQYGINR
ncbi:MAG: prolyl oligopeptidase family serine peptidase [bacterium]